MDEPLLWRVAGILLFNLADASNWVWYHYIEWVAVLFLALQILSALVMGVGDYWFGVNKNKQTQNTIREFPAGKLMQFEFIDELYVTFNKVMTALFSYHAIRYCWTSPFISWSNPLTQFSAQSEVGKNGKNEGGGEEVENVTGTMMTTMTATFLTNSMILLTSIALLYFVYDFGYTLFHWGLHHPSVYRFVHKHHHRQCVPFRGNLDAVNVHPFEFVTGEYNHLLATHLIALGLHSVSDGKLHLHAGAVAFFIIAGGIFASLNHTRYAASLPFGLYQVAYHDVHHARQAFNYGQYTMIWDRIFGTYTPHDDYDGWSGEKKVMMTGTRAGKDDAEKESGPTSRIAKKNI